MTDAELETKAKLEKLWTDLTGEPFPVRGGDVGLVQHFYNGEDMIGMSEDDMLKQDVKILCDKIMGTAWRCLTEAEWKDIDSRALKIGHHPDIINS